MNVTFQLAFLVFIIAKMKFNATSKPFLKGICLSIIFLFSTAHLSAQRQFVSCYVVTTENDTIRGKVEYYNQTDNPKTIKLISASGVERTFSSKEISSAGIGEKRFVPAQVMREVSPIQVAYLSKDPNPKMVHDHVFLEVVYSGLKSLYYHQDNQGHVNFYIESEGKYINLLYKQYIADSESSSSAIHENNKYLGQLSYYLNDCPSISSKLSDVEYNREDLFKVFAQYSKCVDAPISSKNKEITKDRSLFFSAFMGGVFTSVAFDGTSTFDFMEDFNNESSLDYTFGLGVELPLRKRRSKWYLRNELAYYSFAVDVENERIFSPSDRVESRSELGFSYLKFTPMFKYLYQFDQFAVFGNIGVTFGKVLAEKNRKVETTTSPSSVVVRESKILRHTANLESGTVIGLGINYKKISIELRAEGTSGMSNYSDLSGKSFRQYLIFAYQFGKS